MSRLLGPAQIALLGAAALWALSYPVTVSVLETVPPDDLIAVRFVLAAALVVALRPRLLLGTSGRDLAQGALLGMLMMVAIELQTVGLRHVPEATSGFLISLFVVLTPVIGRLALRHRIRAGVWAGAALATAGVSVIAWHGLALRPGVSVTLLSAVVWSLHLIANSAFSTPERALRLTVVQLVVAAAAASAVAAPGGIDVPRDAPAWLAMAYLVVPATVVCYLLQTWAQGAVPAAQAAVLLTCEPVFVAAFAALSGHAPTARELIGGGLIVAAMLVIEVPAVRGWRRPSWTRRPHRARRSTTLRRASSAEGRLPRRRGPISPLPSTRPRQRRSESTRSRRRVG